MRLMPKKEHLIVPKGTKFTWSGELGLRYNSVSLIEHLHMSKISMINVALTVGYMKILSISPQKKFFTKT